MERLSAFSTALRYEFRMQIHRLALWATFLGFAALVFAVAWQGNWTHWSGEKIPLDSFASWTVIINLFVPPATGILLADRLYRDKKLRTDEIFNTTQGSIGSRLLGKYLGSLLATLIPLLLIYCIGIGFDIFHWQGLIGWQNTLHNLPGVLALFLTVILPGQLFIAAFSLVCPMFLWIPLYQFLFVGYWFWGNIFNASRGIPSPSNTILTPFGGYMLAGFFHEDSGMVVHQATFLQGIESLLLLVGIAMGVLFIAWNYLVRIRTASWMIFSRG